MNGAKPVKAQIFQNPQIKPKTCQGYLKEISKFWDNHMDIWVRGHFMVKCEIYRFLQFSTGKL